jgi:hypothetical protein
VVDVPLGGTCVQAMCRGRLLVENQVGEVQARGGIGRGGGAGQGGAGRVCI